MDRERFDALRAEGWASPHENQANVAEAARWKASFLEAEEGRIAARADVERLTRERDDLRMTLEYLKNRVPRDVMWAQRMRADFNAREAARTSADPT